ncbi:MAG: cobalt ECF transporter T component CbiQ [Candidatus Omnitrophica bacterium]|nr:cobalt ECF transporter T component CbiQ [Candidatus Omnitrophota bacterium]
MRHSYIDKYSNIDSLLHQWDPRIKIIAFVLFILFVIFTPPNAFMAFILYAIFLSLLVLLSKLPIQYVLKRSLVIIPFVLMAAAFIPFFKKGEVAGGYSLGTLRLTVTYDGLMIFWNILAKAYLSILCMILLVSSTRFSDLLKAFEKLKCPRIITMIFSFMYRYIFVIQDELVRMLQAKESRSVGGKHLFHIKSLANMVGVLFIRSYERAESVYFAMCARGFDGKIKVMHDFKLTRKDICFLSAVLTILICIRVIGK